MLSQPIQTSSPRGNDACRLPAYVLITPARNEAAFIEQTIQSVVGQTLRPVKWVIVSDGSTDGTDEIVNRYAAQHDWIELVRMPERTERHFAGKVGAFNAGRDRVAGLSYDIIGNLDADITFESDYFSFLMARFAENSRLGVAGTPFRDESLQYDYRFVSTEHVSGCCQMFRKACFEEIGGYKAVKTGGIDLVAVIGARMKGWQTRSFLEKTCIHHRSLGSANIKSVGIGAFADGRKDYSFGCDPFWQIGRCLYRTVTRKPFILAGGLCLAGFFWAMVTRTEIVVSNDLVKFRRAEERRRLGELLKKMLPWRAMQAPSQH
jgi:biofilm PGA synthesis N-glycosyltransferase PgaC